MSTDGINDAFKNGLNFKLLNRTPKGSGITYELKSIFEEMAKAGIIKDKNADGLTKKEALNMFNALNKIHEETGRSTNYTKMNANSDLRYTAPELKVLAEAAGYEVLADTDGGVKSSSLAAPVSVDGKTDNTKITPIESTPPKVVDKPTSSEVPQNPSHVSTATASVSKTPKDVTEFGDNPADYENMTVEQKMAAVKMNDIRDIAGLGKKDKLPENFEVKITNINNQPSAVYYLDGKEIKGDELAAFIDKLKADTAKSKNVQAETYETKTEETKTRKERRTERRQARKDARAQKHVSAQSAPVRERGAVFKTDGEPDRIAYTYKDFVGDAKDISKMPKADILKLSNGTLVNINNSTFIKEGDKLVHRGETNTAFAGDVYYTTESYSISEQGKPDKLVRINNPLGDGFYEYKYDETGRRTSEIKQDNNGNVIQQRDFHNGYNIVDGKYKEIIGADGKVEKLQQFNQFTVMWEDIKEE